MQVDFDATQKYAADIGALVWHNKKARMLFVTTAYVFHLLITCSSSFLCIFDISVMLILLSHFLNRFRGKDKVSAYVKKLLARSKS